MRADESWQIKTKQFYIAPTIPLVKVDVREAGGSLNQSQKEEGESCL